MSNIRIEENNLPLELKKYYSLSAESLGTHLLDYFMKLKGNEDKEIIEIFDEYSLRVLILLFQQKVKKIQTNNIKSRKLRNDLESQFNVFVRNFNDTFFPTTPSQKITITSERGRLIPVDCNCIECSMKLSQGWCFHTNVGDIYFCTLCKEQFFGIGNFKPVNFWSKMIFSGFETNRKKH